MHQKGGISADGVSFAISGLAGLCRYLLGGKLICLGNPAKDERAVGRIAGLEPVGYGKSGFKAIDNDYCINLLLAPLLEDTIHYTSAWGGDAKRRRRAAGLPARATRRDRGDGFRPLSSIRL